MYHKPYQQPTLGRSKLQNEACEPGDELVGEWPRDRLVRMDEKFCRTVERAVPSSRAMIGWRRRIGGSISRAHTGRASRRHRARRRSSPAPAAARTRGESQSWRSPASRADCGWSRRMPRARWPALTFRQAHRCKQYERKSPNALLRHHAIVGEDRRNH